MPLTVKNRQTSTKILQALTKLFLEGRKVILLWIPSHIGISGNEKADLAAKEAASDQTLPTNNTLYFKDLLKHANDMLTSQWKLYWNNTAPPHMKNTTDYPLQQNQYLLDLPRTHQVPISRLRIRHAKIAHSPYSTNQQNQHVNNAAAP